MKMIKSVLQYSASVLETLRYLWFLYISQFYYNDSESPN